MSQIRRFADLSPPKAPKAPHSDTRHGHTRTDDYRWLRAENWQEVFRDPSVLHPDIRAHLEAESAYLEAMLGDTNYLQAILVGKMRSRIREDDTRFQCPTAPRPTGPPLARVAASPVHPCAGRRWRVERPPRRRPGGGG